MKVLLAILLSVAGLAKAQLDAFCTLDSGVYLVPHPTQCSQFIECTGSVGVEQTCLDDKWFDEDYKVCLPQSVAKCEHIPSNDVPSYVLDICSTMEVGQTIPAIACNRYYVCYGTRAFELTCPVGQHYSRAYSSCMNPLKAGCRALNTMCVGEYATYAFPSLTCDEYYVCSSSLLPILNSCPTGLYFSAVNQNCTTPELSDCVNEAPPTTTIDNGVSPTPTCNATNTGTFYSHEKCNWFYMCFNSTALEYPCDCGQYFDDTAGYCIADTADVCND